jgi:hypothetical protein
MQEPQLGNKAKRRRLPAVCINFQDGSLGMKRPLHNVYAFCITAMILAGLRLRESKSCGGATIVSGYARGSNGEILQAEAVVSVQ